MTLYSGLPLWTFDMVRCPLDGGVLSASNKQPFLANGTCRCESCGQSFEIADGILDLLDKSALHTKSQAELVNREEEWAEPSAQSASLSEYDWAEMAPHIAALSLRPEHFLIEFGCGAGRYTRQIQTKCARIVAVDFSVEGLRSIRSFAGSSVALVRADATGLRLAPAAFDRALSTLTSNLPTSTLRQNLFRSAAVGLHDTGRFVIGTHFYGFRARLRGLAKSGYYEGTTTYRHYMTREDLRCEVQLSFNRLRLQPVLIIPPFSRRLGLPLLAGSRLCERLVLLREFGELLMCVAERPRTESAVRVDFSDPA